MGREHRRIPDPKPLFLSDEGVEGADEARSFVRSALSQLPDDVVEDVELVAGELAAQAARNAVSADELRVDDPVEVRVGFTGDWSAGFEVASLVAGGYQVRRTSDGYLLPAPTGPADIRRVR